jgi:DNA polymerase-4
MHIDMNSYFASCEQQDNLAWRGQPLGVCEHLGGMIIAPSVEAKRWGVKTGTPVWEAKVLCPQIILTRASPDRYRFYTAKFYALLEEYTGVLEKYSIDEAFLDLTKACNIRTQHLVDPFQEASRIAQEIKQRIRLEVGDWLRCSVGIGWNKLVAKIASDLQKPDGLVVVRPEEKHLLYQKLKLTDIPGIASRQARRLLKYGIRTLIDLKNCPESHLVSWFGIPGRHLWFMGQLEGFYGEEFGWQPLKSIGHMYTIAREQRQSPVVAQNVLARLAEFVARRLRSLAFATTYISVLLLEMVPPVFHPIPRGR